MSKVKRAVVPFNAAVAIIMCVFQEIFEIDMYDKLDPQRLCILLSQHNFIVPQACVGKKDFKILEILQ